MKADGKETILYRRGYTQNIIDSELSVFMESWQQTADLAKTLKSDTVKNTCLNIINFVCDNFKYKIDPDGVQWLRTPARLYKDKEADCKSFAIFVCSILQNLGIENGFRFASYAKNGQFTHVYSVAIDEQGNKLIVDCVAVLKGYAPFDEVKYIKIKDYMNAPTKISKLSGFEDIKNSFTTETNAATIFATSLLEIAKLQSDTFNIKMYELLLYITQNYKSDHDLTICEYVWGMFNYNEGGEYSDMINILKNFVNYSDNPMSGYKIDTRITDDTIYKTAALWFRKNIIPNIKIFGSKDPEIVLKQIYDNAFNFLYLFANNNLNKKQTTKKANESVLLSMIVANSAVNEEAALNYAFVFCCEKFNVEPLNILNIMFDKANISGVTSAYDATQDPNNAQYNNTTNKTTSSEIKDWINTGVNSFVKIWESITGSKTNNTYAVTPLYQDATTTGGNFGTWLIFGGAIAAGFYFLKGKKNKKNKK